MISTDKTNSKADKGHLIGDKFKPFFGGKLGNFP
jgi:hypothetical protein